MNEDQMGFSPRAVLGRGPKAYEDKLDAVVCAAVAIACLNRKAKAFGDADSAIWVPIAET
jgi:predicted RNase H-like nuclease